MVLEIIEASTKMLRLCLYDDIPPPFDKDSRYAMVFQRVIEIQAEQCDSISELFKRGLFRPAYAILRSILEGMATLVWMSLKIDSYCILFEEGKQPNTKEILKRIGWEDEYERTFQYLSGFVHIDMDSAEFYRNYELGSDLTLLLLAFRSFMARIITKKSGGTRKPHWHVCNYLQIILI